MFVGGSAVEDIDLKTAQNNIKYICKGRFGIDPNLPETTRRVNPERGHGKQVNTGMDIESKPGYGASHSIYY